jgi:hypothetical protein
MFGPSVVAYRTTPLHASRLGSRLHRANRSLPSPAPSVSAAYFGRPSRREFFSSSN